MTSATVMIDKHVDWDTPTPSADDYTDLKADLRYLADILAEGDEQDRWFAEQLRDILAQHDGND
jgi:hypothetical protein